MLVDDLEVRSIIEIRTDTHRTVALRLLLLAAMSLVPWAWAQNPAALEAIPWRLGPGPGTTVELPVVETVQGSVTQRGVPTLVYFTRLDGRSGTSYEAVARAATWQQRHPEVQIVLVHRAAQLEDPYLNAEEARAWLLREGVEVKVVLDAEVGSAFREAFDTNRTPILYLLDEHGTIQDKVVGASLERYLMLDDVLAWAAAGEWEKVAAQRSETLSLGESPARALADVPLGQGRPTVIYHHSSGCPLCQTLVEAGLQAQLNAVAEAHPEARIVILEPEPPSFEAWAEQVERYVALYGRAALPDPVLLALERGRFPDEAYAASTSLLGKPWAPNVTAIAYYDGDENDPQRWWGQPLTPGLMLFDNEGAYQGPAPVWEGPYTVNALVDLITVFLTDR
jgi:hypothetical protein